MAAKVLKLLCVFFSVLTVLCCGCEQQTRRDVPTVDFTAAFAGEYRGIKSIRGELTNNRQGVFTVAFQSPSTLSGARFGYEDNVLNFSQSGFSASADEAILLSDSLPALLHSVFRAVANGDYRQENGKRSYKLYIGGNDCVLTADESGFPQTLSVPCLSCALTFSNAASLDK